MKQGKPNNKKTQKTVEAAVLGRLILDEDFFVNHVDDIVITDFTIGLHRGIFEAMMVLWYNKEGNRDIATIASILQGAGVKNAKAKLATIIEAVPYTKNPTKYLEMLTGECY